jgi:deazaflavin-dependent oxidoreductase (nitroreductase family)
MAEFLDAPSPDPAEHEGMTTTTPAGSSWRFARSTAPVMRALAGRRGFPLWAVVHHRGRRTGRDLAVPVAVMVTRDVFVIALPWGPRTNWVRNVLAAGTCVVRWNGSDHVVTAPVLLDAAAARPYYGRATWTIIQRVLRADAFLLLHRPRSTAGTEAEGATLTGSPRRGS